MADNRLPEPARLAACLSTDEHRVMRDHLSRARVLLEFGIGGSTGLAAEYDLEHQFGVDSHPDWIAHCLRDPRIAEKHAQGRVSLHRVDIGPVGDWGIPTDPSCARRWPAYSLDIWSRLEGREPDFVFVDGRFRLSCALQALLRLPFLPVLGFHDFWDRPHYHTVLEFTDVVERTGQLVILTPKRDMDLRALAIAASATLIDSR
ncbi:hypothetical protein [Roseivivax marinus]|uniref:hypothetical protein n=1 Tax=Roseivivax marinus TaxID=1379903 RepID=UPI00273D7555|nr:hypothetical protein [Roseivivax marinus]